MCLCSSRRQLSRSKCLQFSAAAALCPRPHVACMQLSQLLAPPNVQAAICRARDAAPISVLLLRTLPALSSAAGAAAPDYVAGRCTVAQTSQSMRRVPQRRGERRGSQSPARSLASPHNPAAAPHRPALAAPLIADAARQISAASAQGSLPPSCSSQQLSCDAHAARPMRQCSWCHTLQHAQ